MQTATKKHPTSHTASRVKAPAKGGDNLVHGFASQPGWKMYTGGNLSWQYPLGSNRPINTGSPSFAGTFRQWQFTQVVSMRSVTVGRAQRASSMSGGLLLRSARNAVRLALRPSTQLAFGQPFNLKLPKLWNGINPVRYAGLAHLQRVSRGRRATEKLEDFIFEHGRIIAGPIDERKCFL